MPSAQTPPVSAVASYSSTLTIHRIRLAVKLGYESEERISAQAVEVEVVFYFPVQDAAALSDNGDYLCYDIISNKIADYCASKEFRLIEFLGTEIYRVVRAATPPDVKLKIKATKCNLPVPFILGGASYSYCDLPPFSWVVPD